MKINKPQPERPYSKPKLRKIELKADEVLAVGCKTATGPPKQLGINCLQNNCVDNGS